MPPSVIEPTVGAQEVAKGVMRFFPPGSGTALEARIVNGEPGIIAFRHGAERMDEMFSSRTGRVLAARAPAPRAGYP
jgi:hypothetical protein